jgi:hypothetical protein
MTHIQFQVILRPTVCRPVFLLPDQTFDSYFLISRCGTHSPISPMNRVIQTEVEVTLRPAVSRPVRRPSGTCDQFYFLLKILLRQLRFCNFVAPSPTRGRVRNLLVQLLLGLARAVTLGSKSHRTHGRILLSYLWSPIQRLFSLYSPSTNSTENTSSNNCSIVACCIAITYQWLFFWFNNPCFE